MRYITMTPGGIYGAEYTADNDDDATRQAEAGRYKVLDIVYYATSRRDNDPDLILVVEDENI